MGCRIRGIGRGVVVVWKEVKAQEEGLDVVVVVVVIIGRR